MIQRWGVVLFGIGLMRCSIAAEPTVMHIGTLMQISPQHPLVLQIGQAYHNLGLRMQLETLPLERLRIEAARGELIDGNLAGAETLALLVPQLVRIPVPVYLLDLTAYVRDPQLQIHQWSDLRALKVTYLKGMYSVEDRFKHHGVRPVLAAMTLEQALQYVAKGRVDVAVLPRAEAEYVLRQIPGIKVQAVLPVLEQLPLYHYIHQKHQALVGPLTAQFMNLKAPAPASSAQ